MTNPYDQLALPSNSNSHSHLVCFVCLVCWLRRTCVACVCVSPSDLHPRTHKDDSIRPSPLIYPSVRAGYLHSSTIQHTQRIHLSTQNKQTHASTSAGTSSTDHALISCLAAGVCTANHTPQIPRPHPPRRLLPLLSPLLRPEPCFSLQSSPSSSSSVARTPLWTRRTALPGHRPCDRPRARACRRTCPRPFSRSRTTSS